MLSFPLTAFTVWEWLIPRNASSSLAKEWLEFIQDALFCTGFMLHQSMSAMSSISTSRELSNGTGSWHSCLFSASTTNGRKVWGPELLLPFLSSTIPFLILC